MILAVDGVGFSYNHRPVLKDVSFELARGQTLGVLGINGAGKSTLLKCLNRILKPQRGVILLDQRDVRGLSGQAIARRAGYVPQGHGLDQLNVFEAVLLGRKPHIKWQATSKDMAVVEEILALLRLEDLALRPVETLSGGEAQKVALARALAQEPEVLLLDEPTSNLDLRNQLEVMDLIAGAVRERNVAAVACLHDINLAFRHLDYVMMLKDGSIHILARPREITAEMIREVYGVEVVLGRILEQTVVIPTRAA